MEWLPGLKELNEAKHTAEKAEGGLSQAAVDPFYHGSEPGAGRFDHFHHLHCASCRSLGNHSIFFMAIDNHLKVSWRVASQKSHHGFLKHLRSHRHS